ncbi:MAG TPA: sugar ABC transporter ATP-binding protein [Opitutaceae bacterium]|nr:sugar ABC transporter ATP-binding protein [Opitutaceae bacterium]
MTFALEVRGIEKSFSGVPVLRGVTFALEAGKTLGLVGENGAGKSTLMNILGGGVQADAGQMLLGGVSHAPRTPADAARAGVAFVHQELNLFPNLTIAENIFLTAFPTRSGAFIRYSAIYQRTAELLREVGLDTPPDTPVENLSTGQRQLVEIAKALSRDARILIFDEPTSSLSARECEQLFKVMGQLRRRGLTMIYISHQLGDVLRLCDSVVVLRDGIVAGSGPTREFTADRLVVLMVGRALTQLYPSRRGSARSEIVFEARGLGEPRVIHDISFALRRGEILGVAGLMGAGRSELARILFGLDPHSRGAVFLEGKALHRASPTERISRGLAFLTEDRRHEGLCLDASIADNLMLVALRDFARTPLKLLNRAMSRATLQKIRERIRLNQNARDEQPVRTLSGGNQQKVVLGKWLLVQPRVLILDEPTRGVDVGAKFEIYSQILELADGGAGILIISSEIEELLGLCDRVLVMNRGEIRDELSRPEFDRERILQSALPAELFS